MKFYFKIINSWIYQSCSANSSNWKKNNWRLMYSNWKKQLEADVLKLEWTTWGWGAQYFSNWKEQLEKFFKNELRAIVHLYLNILMVFNAPISVFYLPHISQKISLKFFPETLLKKPDQKPDSRSVYNSNIFILWKKPA